MNVVSPEARNPDHALGLYFLTPHTTDDGHKLARDFSIRSRSLLELSSLARKVDPIGTGPGSVMISLRNLVKGYLGYELEKGDVRTSDWSVKLTREQQECE